MSGSSVMMMVDSKVSLSLGSYKFLLEFAKIESLYEFQGEDDNHSGRRFISCLSLHQRDNSQRLLDHCQLFVVGVQLPHQQLQALLCQLLHFQHQPQQLPPH